ncbi:MAG: DapH/DapD/GlmU-related protein, partial [Candidatus Peregrinibacteria bacterium]
VGKRSIVANNALVRGSSIGDDCVVGYSTEVKASALASHVWTHMTYIGDSLIGRNVSFGGGTVTGNLRLDEAIIDSVVGTAAAPTGLTKFGTAIGDNCRLGIHTTIYPGVKVGTGSFVASGVLLSEDVPDRSFASMKEGKLAIRPNRTEVPMPEKREEFRKKVEGK